MVSEPGRGSRHTGYTQVFRPWDAFILQHANRNAFRDHRILLERYEEDDESR